MTFDEDRSQVRTAHGPQVMAMLRNLAISRLRLAGQRNLAAARTINQLDETTRSFDATFKALEPSIIGAAIDGRL